MPPNNITFDVIGTNESQKSNTNHQAISSSTSSSSSSTLYNTALPPHLVGHTNSNSFSYSTFDTPLAPAAGVYHLHHSSSASSSLTSSPALSSNLDTSDSNSYGLEYHLPVQPVQTTNYSMSQNEMDDIISTNDLDHIFFNLNEYNLPDMKPINTDNNPNNILSGSNTFVSLTNSENIASGSTSHAKTSRSMDSMKIKTANNQENTYYNNLGAGQDMSMGHSFMIKTEPMTYNMLDGSSTMMCSDMSINTRSGMTSNSSSSLTNMNISGSGGEVAFIKSKNGKVTVEKRYGPIVVRPRRHPAPTLASGRKSKYTTLDMEEEQKREVRRRRNRQAAEKCKMKRFEIEQTLERDLTLLLNDKTRLDEQVAELYREKVKLEQMLKEHVEYSSCATGNAKKTSASYSTVATSNTQLFNNSTSNAGVSGGDMTQPTTSEYSSMNTLVYNTTNTATTGYPGYNNNTNSSGGSGQYNHSAYTNQMNLNNGTTTTGTTNNLDQVATTSQYISLPIKSNNMNQSTYYGQYSNNQQW